MSAGKQQQPAAYRLLAADELGVLKGVLGCLAFHSCTGCCCV
jgi:hypothetical protein